MGHIGSTVLSTSKMRVCTVKSREHTELCKAYEDADTEEEGIDTTNLNKDAYKEIRKFLFGTCTEDSEKSTCSAWTFGS